MFAGPHCWLYPALPKETKCATNPPLPCRPRQIEFTCVSEKQPTPEQLEDIKFAWLCVKHVKSNAITGGLAGRGTGGGEEARLLAGMVALLVVALCMCGVGRHPTAPRQPHFFACITCVTCAQHRHCSMVLCVVKTRASGL